MNKKIKEWLPFWNELSLQQKNIIETEIQVKYFTKGEVIYNISATNNGLKIVTKGCVRLFITSGDGRDITLYRVRNGEICVVGYLQMNMEIHVEAERETEMYIIPTHVYHILQEKNAAVKDFTIKILTDRFLEMAYLVGNVVNFSVQKRLAGILLKRIEYEKDGILHTTHDVLAKDTGSAREVVSRILKEFEKSGWIQLSRGKIIIIDKNGLRKILE